MKHVLVEIVFFLVEFVVAVKLCFFFHTGEVIEWGIKPEAREQK